MNDVNGISGSLGLSARDAAERAGASHTILVGFVSLLALFLLLLALSVRELHKMEQRVSLMVEQGLGHVALVEEMRAAARQRTILALKIFNEPDPFVRDEILMRYDELANRYLAAHARLLKRAPGREEQLLLERAMQAAQKARHYMDAAVSATQQDDDKEKAESLLLGDALPKQAAMLEVLAQLSDYALKRAQSESHDAQAAFEHTRDVIIFGSIVFVLGGIGIVRWMRRRMFGLMSERLALTATLHETLRNLTFQQQALDAHAIVSVADAAGNIVYVNDRFCQVSGYAREELVGKNHRVVKSSVHPESFFAEIWDTISSGRIWQGEVCNRAKDGHLYWVATTIVPFLDENQIPSRYVSIRTDITAIKDAEAALRRSMENLEHKVAERTKELNEQLHFSMELMEALPNPVFYKGVNGYYLGVNRAWEKFFGIPRERIVGHKLDVIYPSSPEVATRHAAMDELLWQGEGRQEYEIRLPAAGGEMRDAMYYKAVLTNAVGGIIGLVGVIVDLTAYRQVEEALRQFKSTLDQTQDCVFMFAPDTLRFNYVNHGAISQVGYGMEELLNMTPLDINPSFTEARFRELLRPLMQGGSSAVTFETVHRHKNGHDIPVEIVLQYVSTVGAPRFVAVVRDIAERKQAQEELHRRYGELQALNIKLKDVQHQLLQSEKMASIGQLAAGVAHEINNPIGYVFSNLGSLENYLRDLFTVIEAYESVEASLADAAARVAVEDARKKADLAFLKEDVGQLMNECREGITRVKKIVQDLKDFSRIDSNDEWQWADLHKGLDGTLNIMRNELKYKADIIKEYGDIPEVECLPSQLNQVFLNLLVNAGHAIEQRGTISIRTGTENEQVWVEIEDTGKGIAPEHLDRIFDPFFTTKPVGTGTGLGLSLSYGIINKHQGHIEVSSQVEKGTRFRIWLPIRQNVDLAVEGP